MIHWDYRVFQITIGREKLRRSPSVSAQKFHLDVPNQRVMTAA
jgi:hypothetical protein